MFPVPGFPHRCPNCDSPHLEWFPACVNKSSVVQGRLTTHDVQCVFFLGCEACSETIGQTPATAIAHLLNSHTSP